MRINYLNRPNIQYCHQAV